MRAWIAAFGGVLAVAFSAGAAKAAHVIVVNNGCVENQFVLPGDGGIANTPIALCAGVPGMISSSFSVEVGTNHAQHIHRAIYVSPSGPYPPFTIETSPPWTADGFLIQSWVNGFASFQGNPGDIFSWSVKLEATYAGVTIFSEASGVQTAGGNVPFHDFDWLNCKGCATGGPFLTTLTVTLSGPGELHLSNTGVGGISAVPEPANWALMIAGFGVVGMAVRRRRAAPMRPA